MLKNEDVICSNAINIMFILSTFLSRLMPACYLSLCDSSLMNFTYEYHADTDMLFKGLVSLHALQLVQFM